MKLIIVRQGKMNYQIFAHWPRSFFRHFAEHVMVEPTFILVHIRSVTFHFGNPGFVGRQEAIVGDVQHPLFLAFQSLEQFDVQGIRLVVLETSAERVQHVSSGSVFDPQSRL